MARKNPVGKLTDAALTTLKGTLKDPKAAAGKAVGQAKTTVAFGRALGSTAGAVAGHTAGKVAERVGVRRPEGSVQTGAQVKGEPTARGGLRAVPEVNEPAGMQPPGTVGETRPAEEDSPKAHGDALAPTQKAPAAKKAPATKAPAKKAPAKKAAGTQEPAKTAAKKAPAKKAPATKAPAKKTAQSAASPADVAEVVESKVAEDPTKTAARPAKKAPGSGTTKKAPASKTTKKAPAKKAASTGGPGDKLPTKKSVAAKQPGTAREGAPARDRADQGRPRTAAEIAAAKGKEATTPAGTTAAAEGLNPETGDTGLTQPGTEPVVDSATAKKVASESKKLRKASETTPE